MVIRGADSSCQILYAGPGLSGRTTTIRAVFERVPEAHRIRLARPTGRPAWSLEAVFSHPAFPVATAPRVTLFAAAGALVSSPLYLEAARVANAIVFVIDSQAARIEAGAENVANYCEHLQAVGRSHIDLPCVLQYNKRDLPAVDDFGTLEREVNVHGWPSFMSVARTGSGVLEPLDHVLIALTGRALGCGPG